MQIEIQIPASRLLHPAFACQRLGGGYFSAANLERL
jgi:hypothetical protein